MTLQQGDYLQILDTAAQLAQFGFAVFRWQPSDRYPRYEWVNDAVVARTKFDREALLGEDPVYLRLGNNVRMVDLARESVTRGDVSPFEVELTAADGAAYWVEAVAHRLEPAADGSDRFVVATHAISRRKEHERFRTILTATIDSEPDGVFIVRLRGESLLAPPVIYVNPAFARMTGYSQDDLSAGIYPRLLGDASNRLLVGENARAVLRGEAVVAEVQLYRKDGSTFWAEVRAHPLESPTIHCALTIRDVTDRRAAQEAMHMLSEGVGQASDFMIVTDDTLPSAGGPKILNVNRSFLEATGYAEEELIGSSYTMIYSPHNTPPVMDAILRAIEAGQPNYREVLAQRKDGSEFWIEFVDRPFTTRFGRRLRLMVGRDITVRRRSTNQLSLLFAATEQAETPIVIYDANDEGDLTFSYENETAAQRQHYHLIELWKRGDTEGRSTRRRLESGEVAIVTYTRNDESGASELVQMAARPIRNESRLEAVLTQERILATKGAASRSAHARVIELATMLPALDRAKGLPERVEALGALLRSTFGASIERLSYTADGSVHIDEVHRVAVFAQNGIAARVTWPEPLEPLAVTAVRFAIEAALDGA
ncbi:MAG TPA: PAS domain S-box protein [Candidatus Acidoferrales bacterium]|nr:PAS domain S-box protein [Candidatus Acidoferrales bacterium]